MKYTEFKKIKEERMNTLDIKFAFTEEHFNQIMKEWGLRKEIFMKAHDFSHGMK